MKKLISLLVVVFTVALSGCGSESDKAKTNSKQPAKQVSPVQAAPEPESAQPETPAAPDDAESGAILNVGVYGLWRLDRGPKGHLKIEKEAVSSVVPCEQDGKRFGSAVARAKAEITETHISIKENKKHSVSSGNTLSHTKCSAEIRAFTVSYKVEGDTLVMFDGKGNSETYHRIK